MERQISHSQNFLHSFTLVDKLVANSSISSNDIVVEIGPGKGIITKALATRAKSVTAVEFDSTLAKKLKENFSSEKKVKIIEMDFMKFILPDENYKIFSNIPFNMTAEILQKVLSPPQKAIDMYIIMQYEACLKYAGKPYYAESFRSLLYKPFYEVTVEYEFASTDFSPVPKARIVLARFHKKDESDIKLESYQIYSDLLSYLFSAKGRTFKEKTKDIFTYPQQKHLKQSSGISMDSIITEWTYQQWLAIFDCYMNFVSADKKQKVESSYSKLTKTQSKLNKVHKNRRNANGIGKKTRHS